ncbi:MAG: glycosyltransferase [Actinomycetota bacterium]
MIVFGTAVTDPELYDRCAAEGIRRTAGPDSVVLAHQSAGSLFRNYNLLLDMAAEHEDLEALVLVHQDAEIDDLDFAAKVRDVLRDPDVAIIGCVGAVGVRSIAWWQGAVTWASVTHRYEEFGGGDTDAAGWDPEKLPSYAHPGEVDSIDGVVMVLSPWAVRELRFDESLGNLHGYDFDICMQARTAGKKVVTADFRVIHYHSLELINDPEAWTLSYIRLVEKWKGQLPDTGADPEQRALRAEAQAACARGISVSNQLENQAIRRQLARTEAELEDTRRKLTTFAKELAKMKRDANPTAATSDSPWTDSVPGLGRAAIDCAFEDLGIESFASLEVGQACGQYAFYAIAQPGVERGRLINAGPTLPSAYLLSAIELAAERPGMDVVEGSVSDPETIAAIGQVDAVLLLDVLLHLVDPDWDDVLELYAPSTSSFVIANPQWERGDATVRLLDLGREKFLEAVPPWLGNVDLLDHLDEWDPAQQRPYRDSAQAWQWGITDADLRAKMDDLGFACVWELRLDQHPETDGFIDKAFVFARADRAEGGDESEPATDRGGESDESEPPKQ